VSGDEDCGDGQRREHDRTTARRRPNVRRGVRALKRKERPVGSTGRSIGGRSLSRRRR
jgi:hypothetical protein